MTNQPLVSVIIPTYERVKLTLAAVQSVIDQDYSNYEIIVIDDGSSISTLANLRMSLPQGVRLICLPHSGLPAIARNAGISQAKGEWIAFLDSDDLWKSNKLTVQIQAALQNNFDAVSAEFSIDSPSFDPEINKIHMTRVRIKSILKCNSIVNSSVLVRKKSLDEVGWISSVHNVRGVEDYATWLRIITLYRWGHVKDTLGVYLTSNTEEERISSHSNSFNHFHAIIDYLGWLRHRGHRLILARVLLRLIPKSIGYFK